GVSPARPRVPTRRSSDLCLPMKTSHGEYRRHFRTGIRIPVTVDIADQSRSTSTLNLSFSGLRLAKPEDLSLEPGQALNIQFSRPGNFRVPARVVHVGEHHVGLKQIGRAHV